MWLAHASYLCCCLKELLCASLAGAGALQTSNGENGTRGKAPSPNVDCFRILYAQPTPYMEVTRRLMKTVASVLIIKLWGFFPSGSFQLSAENSLAKTQATS